MRNRGWVVVRNGLGLLSTILIIRRIIIDNALNDFLRFFVLFLQRVIESKNADYPVGAHVTTFAGWTTHAVVPGDKLVKVPEYPPDVPIGLALGLLGMTG